MNAEDLGTRRYVVGFLFSENRKMVALIGKKKPTWQAGRLNGIGGSIEVGESARDAMIREFREETGVHIDGWTEFADMHCFNGDAKEEARVIFFHAFHDDIGLVKQTTKEPVFMLPVETLPYLKTLNNVQWMIPMALAMGGDPLVKAFRLERWTIKENL